MVFLVHKHAGNRPRSTVEVLVGTPGSKVDPPIMKPQRYIADGVGQIKTDGDIVLPGCFGDGSHVVNLPGVIIQATHPDQGQFVGVFGNGVLYVSRVN